MNRPLFPIALAYLLGLILGSYFHFIPITIIFVPILYITIEATLIGSGYIRRSLSPFLFAVICLGIFYYHISTRIPANDISHSAGSELTVEGWVDVPPESYPSKTIAFLRAVRVHSPEGEREVKGRIRLGVYIPSIDISYGDILKVEAKVKSVRGFRNPGGFDYEQYLARQDVRTRATITHAEKIVKIGNAGNPLLKMFYQWREEIRKAITGSLSGPSSAILRAMIIADNTGLTPEIRDHFMTSGVTHILSISGSHLGLVSFFIFTLTRVAVTILPAWFLLRLTVYITPKKIAAMATIPPVLFYTFISGGQIATIRSLIMILVYLIAILLERDDDILNTLSLAALIVLIKDPQAIFDISFQLSYLSVLFMALGIQWRKGLLKKEDTKDDRGRFLKFIKEKGIVYLLITISATMATAPLVAYYFNLFTWVGIISNIIVVPVAGLIVVPVGLATSVFSLFYATPFLPFAGVNEFFLSIFYSMVRFFSRFPFAEIRLPSPSLAFILLYYITTLSIIAPALSLRTKGKIVTYSMLLLILLSGHALIFHSNSELEVSFLDVGQGDSAVIGFPDGRVMVIDTGGSFSEDFDIGRLVVAPYLWDKGIRKIDYLVLSHQQADHIGGAGFLLQKFDVGELWDNGGRPGSFASKKIEQLISDKGVKYKKVEQSSIPRIFSGCEIYILHPSGDFLWKYVDNKELDENDRSLVIKIKYGDVSFLFPGDLEKMGQKELLRYDMPLTSTVIKVPHHGGRSAVDGEFINKVNPRFAIISVGYQNPYRHPTAEALDAYIRSGAKIHRTDESGAIIIRTDGRNLQVRNFLETKEERVSLISVKGANIRMELRNIARLIGGGT